MKTLILLLTLSLSMFASSTPTNSIICSQLIDEATTASNNLESITKNSELRYVISALHTDMKVIVNECDVDKKEYALAIREAEETIVVLDRLIAKGIE